MIHLYTGEGKGKTTAAVGMCIRMLGAGKKVLFVQFMKGNETGEIKVLSELKRVDILRCQKAYPFLWEMTRQQKKEITSEHNEMMWMTLEGIGQRAYDMVILDEITYPIREELVDIKYINELFKKSSQTVELVLTGRNAPEWLIEKSDYVTQMNVIRHPFENGVQAREGIEY